MLLFGAVVLCGCAVRPAFDIAVEGPWKPGTLQIQVWPSLMSEGQSFKAVVSQNGRSITAFLWQDWGPAQRASIYTTPDHWIVVVGGNALARAIKISGPDGPKQVPDRLLWRKIEQSDSWLYVGAVDSYGMHRYPVRFFPPDEQAECIRRFSYNETLLRPQHTFDKCPTEAERVRAIQRYVSENGPRA